MLDRTWLFLAPMAAFRPAPSLDAWSWLLRAAPLCLLAGCTSGPFSGFNFGSGQAVPPAYQAPPSQNAAAPTSTKVGILLPLSGGNAQLGHDMLQAAQLALASPGSPELDPYDTAPGATAAAQAAVASGDGILLGPLTSSNTADAAPVATGAGVPMLAFTSDVARAQVGVWVLGETPEQQVHRLVFAAKAEGRSRLAALLPGNALGKAMAASLVQACADAGLPPPRVVQHDESMGSINAQMRSLADFANRRGAIEQKIKDDKANPDPAIQAQADALADEPIPPPPFDALLLGDTGVQLQEVITVLRYYDVSTSQVRIMGPGLWSAFAGKLGTLAGAWFAAPDSKDRVGFAERYQAKYGVPPKMLADIPYDAAALARNLANSGGYGAANLTRPDGFAGVDGVFALMPDGHVQRGLAIFQIQPGGGAAIVQPAPQSLQNTTS